MSEKIPTDIFAFVPYQGGRGVRISLSTVAITAVEIPGGQSGGGAPSNARVLLSNGGTVSAFILLGVGDDADLNCMEVLPGTQVVVGAPYTATQPLKVSGITESGTTKVWVGLGLGT